MEEKGGVTRIGQGNGGASLKAVTKAGKTRTIWGKTLRKDRKHSNAKPAFRQTRKSTVPGGRYQEKRV